ncbi:hypothetical protein ASG87_05840 [Frateuria sp. Soil773]|uniref:hypothetical protein n=1 Tax=Frateuria sp. Soil773 TaxID=1736407 RepID=UPI0006FEB9C9|nr:hypothetical protein [Frateuria sp. Soil773]KRE89064.1 hypothetical protein ASG87_05840 [Frateuria sp. Soil773]
MLRRFSANHTHLYPGAFLRALDALGGAMPSRGDGMLVEFSDGVVATGRLQEADGDAVVLRMPGYRTRRGTDVAPKAWRLVPADEPGQMKVQGRLPAA